MKKLYNRLFNRWSKWQLIKENEIRTKIVSNPILGYLSEDRVCVSTYIKTNIYTGKVKSKFVEI